jgi:hypothetical protein
MEPYEEIKSINALPKSLFRDISEVINGYSTALIMVRIGADEQEAANLIGSGTFISSAKATGILTAAHVVDAMKGSYLLGLTLREHEHRYLIESKYLNIIRIAKGQVESDGPDLALIVLPTSELGIIRANRTFYNLDRNRERMLSAPPGLDTGIWSLCGYIDILTTNETSERGFASLKGFHGLCGFGGVRREYKVGDFDYYNYEVSYEGRTDIPETFGGMSGGGLWQIPLRMRSDQIIEPKEFLLSGLAFYQTQRTGLNRIIKCHGRKSIYEIMQRELRRFSL